MDELLASRGLAESTRRAVALILAGRVFVDGRRVDKAGVRIPAASQIEVSDPPRPYVSRGGLKLDAAMTAFAIDVSDRVALDVGASTGGFTDCLLQRGARRVYAVDTGYGKLDATLRHDARVVLREHVNARFLDREILPEEIDVAAVDVSFISLRLVLPAIVPFIAAGGAVIALVKPQFEARREEVPRGGVLRDAVISNRVVEEVARAGEAVGLVRLGRCESPVRGARGNTEFFLAFDKR